MDSFLVRTSDFAAAIAYAIFIVCGLIGLVLRPARNFCGTALYVASFAIGANVWIRSVVIVYTLWGVFALLLGLLIAGVGVVPMALLATAFHGLWSVFGYVLLNILLAYGCRGAGLWLSAHTALSSLETS